MKISGEGLERLHGCGIPIGWDGDEMLSRSAIDAGNVRIDAIQDGW
jgi:hypothetical protein